MQSYVVLTENVMVELVRDWMHHFFIYLFICWSNIMTALLQCYHSTALCTSNGDISASAICYLWRFFLVHYYVGRTHSLLLLLRWPFL